MQDKSKYDMEFVVIKSSCNINFSNIINARLKEGWELKDDIKVSRGIESDVIYSQAMVRYKIARI